MPAKLKQGPRAVSKQTRPRGGRQPAKRQSGIVASLYRDVAGLEYNDEDRLRLGIQELVSMGPHGEFILNKFKLYLNTRPDVHMEARNNAICELADLIKIERTLDIVRMTNTYRQESTKQIAGNVADKIREYEKPKGGWEQDRWTEHAEKPRNWTDERWFLFKIMRHSTENQGPPEQSRIAGILRTYWNAKVISSNEIAVASARIAAEAVSTQPIQAEVSALMDKQSQKQKIVLDGLTEGPIGKEILESEKARVIAERTRIKEELVKLEEHYTRVNPLLWKARDDLVQAQLKFHQAARDMQAEINTANCEIARATNTCDRERLRLENLLLYNEYDSHFDDFFRYIRDLNDAARRAFEYQEYWETHPVTGKQRIVGYSNKASIEAYLEAVSAAANEAGRLRFAADQTDLPAKLDALKVGFPTIARAQRPDSK